MVGMSVTDVSQKAIANLGWTDIKLTAPGLRRRHALRRVGGARQARVEARARAPASSPCKTIGLNQDGKVVCTFNRTMLIAKRGHSVEDKVNY